LRGLALLTMLLFHGEVSWGAGGFISITLFFTLSGFLVTTLLLEEHDQHGGIAIATFWARRARRLLPSALLTIAAVLALTPHLGDLVQRAEIRGDAIASTLYVANWRFLSSGQGYDAQFGGDSPLLHFWSLAIEEQFYLGWPCVVFVVLGQYRSRRNGRRILGALVGLGIGVSVVSSALSSSLDRSYYGTDTRAAELMVGAALALLVASPRFASVGRRLARGAPLALAAFSYLVVTARLDDEWIRRGGRLGIALISASLVAAAWFRHGQISRVFATEPIGAIGRISYTWYLVHWPVFRFLDQRRTELDGYALFALRIAVSAVIASVVYHGFECPMRFRRWIRVPRLEFAGAIVATVAVLGFAWSTSVVAIPEVGDSKFAVDRPTGTKPTALVLGDKQAHMRVESSKNFRRVEHIDLVDCPLAPADELRDATGTIRPVGCRADVTTWRLVGRPRADVVIVVLGAAEVDDVSVDGAWTSLDSLDRLTDVRAALDRLVAESHAAGSVTVVIQPSAEGRGAVLRDAVVGSTSDALGATVATSLEPDDLRSAVAAARLENRPPWPTPLGSSPPEMLRVLVVGDSTSFWVAAGLEAVGKESGQVETAWLGAAGCPLVRAGEFQSVFDTVELAACPRFDEDWGVAAESFGPDIVLVVSSIIDAGEYRLERGGSWVAFGDARFDAYWRAEADAAIAELAASGAVIVWADAPTVQLVEGDATARWNLRLARYNELVAALDADYDQVVTAAFSTPLGAPGSKVDRDQRPDGSHLAPEAAVAFAREWLLAELGRLWRESVTTSVESGCMTGAGPRPTIDLPECISAGSESR
jgi:peptidoglycan/LPS O-acetylase OafA/YrhL